MRINLDEYLRIRKTLRDVRSLGEFSYPRGVLHSILLQRRIESVKRKYRMFADRLDEIVDFWRENRKLPRWLTLPPVMKVRLLLKGLGFSTKAINRILRNPNEAEDEDLQRLVARAVSVDYVYSPLATRLQTAKGKLGEMMLRLAVEKLGVEYRTEDDLRGEFSKTPDVYFEEPVEVNGREVRWIESKAMFGDPITHAMFERKQYSRYREMFGDGIVIYWFGCVRGVEASDGSEFAVEQLESVLSMRVYVGSEEKAEEIGAVFVEPGDPFESAFKAIDVYSRCKAAVVDKNAARLLKNMGFEVVYL